MWRFGFLSSVRFWVATWIVILIIGLTPLPPVAEFVIVVGFVAHGVWLLQHRLRVIASRRTLDPASASRAHVGPPHRSPAPSESTMWTDTPDT